MARQQIKNYVFTPGGAGVGKVKISGNYDISDILTILNATDQTFIYNFADPLLGGVVTWSAAYDADFPQGQDGVTTLIFTTSTATMSAADSLGVYVEAESQTIRPWPFGTDAIERMRVSNPKSLIDADFEYGLQNTKWQSIFLNNDIPSLYELPGSELTSNTAGYVTFIGQTPITSTGTTSITLMNQTGVASPNWTQNDYMLIVNPYVAGANVQTYTTANVINSNQRSLTVANTAGFAVNDQLLLAYLGLADTTTVTTTISSGATTTLVVGSGTAIATGATIMVQTDTTDLWELMTVTAGGTSTNLTVTRRRLNTNSGNVNITSGQSVRLISNVEVGIITSIESNVNMSINRSWMNTVGADNLLSGSVIQKLNFDALTGSGSNVEIVKATTIGTAVANAATISRGTVGTTAISAAPVGSIAIRMTGLYQAGSTNVPQIGMNVIAHGGVSHSFISTTNHSNANTEGMYQLQTAETNHMFYYPRRTTNLNIGYPLNRYDTQIRKAALFTGAAIPLSTIVSDEATPSTITVTTPYAHGMSPGTPINVDLLSGTNVAWGDGSFTILSIPTPTTFTYQGKTGAAVSGSLTAKIYIKTSAFFIHRPFDGGVNIGSGTPHHGAMAARQSKKYFRYQSGKGLFWSSGTLLSTNFDVANISADGTTALSSTITITTENEHYLQIGANIKLNNIATSGYDNYYRVTSITSDSSFTVTAQETLGSATPKMDIQPKVNLASWHGSTVRAGIYDDQNGAYWEYTGTNLNVVLRSATLQLCGFVTTEVGSNLIVGDGTCRFAEQLTKYSRVVIRGMGHIVTSITDNNTMTVSPPWRGASNQIRVKMALVNEFRIPQSQFNLDKIDGTGPSGFQLNITKMQMLMIQYAWYGAGFVEYGLRGPNGAFIMVHRIKNNNVNDEAYMRSGNLPVRYAANNESATDKLIATISAGDTSMDLVDATQFPPASVAYPVYVVVDNEVIKYSSIDYSLNRLGNLTRASAFTLWQDGSSKSFTMGTAESHTEGTGVTVLSCTSAPTLNHWGSAVIMDGGFDEDRGYSFTYSAQNYTFPATTNGVKTAFLMRLTPSVSNTIIGDLGTRDLINRAQLELNDMVVNYTGTNARFLIEGILNPTNITATATTWINLNTAANGFQPSFTQFSTSPSYISGTYASGGERLFAIPVNQTNSGVLDLSRVKQLVTSAIPGNGVYPDGPEILAINITSITATAASGEIQISFTESQA
jgi:hypothetical protein